MMVLKYSISPNPPYPLGRLDYGVQFFEDGVGTAVVEVHSLGSARLECATVFIWGMFEYMI